MLPLDRVEILEYLEPNGRSPYAEWFNSLNPPAAAKAAVALARLSQGNFSNVKSVAGGVHECWINFGPGYRMYFGKDGERVVLLLGAELRSGSRETSPMPLVAGRNTSLEKNRRLDSGSHPGFQGNDSGAGAA